MYKFASIVSIVLRIYMIAIESMPKFLQRNMAKLPKHVDSIPFFCTKHDDFSMAEGTSWEFSRPVRSKRFQRSAKAFCRSCLGRLDRLRDRDVRVDGARPFVDFLVVICYSLLWKMTQLKFREFPVAFLW